MTTSPRQFLEHIGPYRVIRPLGRGGAASVFEVEVPSTGQRLALKLHNHPLGTTRFEREYQTLAALDHPNVVRVYEYGFTDDQLPYLTMELLDGVPAQAHAKATGRPGTPLRTGESVRIGMMVAEALTYLHGRGIIHRDLKSSNVMVLADGVIKLLDLGTARLEGAEGITRQGEFVGTFTYASPEQLSGRPVDGRSDLYSLGVLLYRLLTGRRPFEEDDPRELARMHLEVTPVSPLDIVPQVPAVLANLVLRLLAKAPDERPSTAWEVATELRNTAIGEPPNVLGDPWLEPPPLLGRHRELRVLDGLLDDPRPGGMALVLGADGSGRRRLMAEATDRARRRGCKVYQASFPGQSGLGGLLTIAQQAARDHSDRATAEATLNLLREASPAPPAASRLVLFHELFSLLRRRTTAHGRPVVLILHQLHRARLLALQAVRALRLRAADTGVPLVIIASAEPDTSAGGRRLSTVRAPLARHFSNALQLELPPLSAVDCGQLVSAMLGTAPPNHALAERIRAASGGSPGHIDAMVRSALRVHGASRGRVALPASPAQAVALHVASLSRLCLRVLEVLSVAGGEASTDIIGAAAEIPASELRAALLALARDGFVVPVDDGGVESWRLRGALLRDHLASLQVPERCAALQERIAAALASAPPTPAKIRLLAAAGALDPAITEAVAWAERRLDDGQAEEVLPVLDELVERGSEALATPTALLARLLLCHARAVSLVDPTDPVADRSLSQVAALATEPVRHAEVDLYTGALYRRRGELTRARARLSRASRLAEGVPGGRLYAALRLARAADASDVGNLEIAAAAYEEARRGAERSGELRLAARGRLGAAAIRFARGELEAAEREVSRVMGSMGRTLDDHGLWRAASLQAANLRVQGRYSEARTLINRHRDAARLSGAITAQATLLIGLADIELDLHRIADARRLLGAAAELDPGRFPVGVAAAYTLAQGRLAIIADSLNAAIDLLEHGQERARAQKLVVFGALLASLCGAARLRAGDRAGDSVAAEAIRALAAAGHLPALAQACLFRAEALGDHLELARVFAPVQEWLDASPARALRVSSLRFALRFAVLQGDARHVNASRDALREALGDMLHHLESPDREALLQHPWYSAILAGTGARTAVR